MRLNAAERALVQAVPLMQCGNRLEFQQRLQWLSEGMLANHMYPSRSGGINHEEIAAYQRFKEKKQ